MKYTCRLIACLYPCLSYYDLVVLFGCLVHTSDKRRLNDLVVMSLWPWRETQWSRGHAWSWMGMVTKARQTWKEQTRISGYMLEGPRPCTTFWFALIHYVTKVLTFSLRNVTIGYSCSVRSKQLLCFVNGQDRKRKQKHDTKNLVRFHNHCLSQFSTYSQA